MARFISPITDLKANGSVNFLDANTNLPKITYKDELETIPNDLSVPVNANGNLPNIFFSGSATVIYLDEFDVQYASRTPVGEEVGIGNFTGWSANIIYSNPDITIGSNDKFYLSITDGNQDNDPTTDEVNWEEIRFIGLWNTNITYDIGIVVQTTDGILWRSLTSAAGNNPSTDDGTNWAAQGESTITTPTNTTPAASATDVSSTPTLVSSAFSSTNDIHLHSNWQITLATDTAFSSPVFNVINSDLETTTVPDADALDGEIEYIWRVRYVGVNGFSDFSTATSFTTAAAYNTLVSTTLVTGNGSALSAVTGIDSVNKDVLTVVKNRNAVTSYVYTDTKRGVNNRVYSDSNTAELTTTGFIEGFNVDGVDLGSSNFVNGSGNGMVIWQWVEAPGLFAIVEFNGTTAAQNIAHPLNEVVGHMDVKNLDTAADWRSWSRAMDNDKYLVLNEPDAEATDATVWDSTTPTNTVFRVGTNVNSNGNGNRMIAYLHAHNPAKGKYCGEYTGDGVVGNEIVVGFPVGRLRIKRKNNIDNWLMHDSVRGGSQLLTPNLNNAESTITAVEFTATGFKLNTISNDYNAFGNEYIFIAEADPLLF